MLPKLNLGLKMQRTTTQTTIIVTTADRGIVGMGAGVSE